MIRQAWAVFRNIKIIKFSDDSYGIRKGWLWYRFQSKKGRWVSRDQAWTCLEFQPVATRFENRWVDDGQVVYYERLQVPVNKEGHLEPEKDYHKKGWNEVLHCPECKSLGTYNEIGADMGDCKVCGYDRWFGKTAEKYVAKWEGDHWRIAQ